MMGTGPDAGDTLGQMEKSLARCSLSRGELTETPGPTHGTPDLPF